MKKSFPLLIQLFILLFTQNYESPCQTISSTFGNSFFVQGVSPVTNTYYVTNYPIGTTAVGFAILDSNNILYNGFPDINPLNGFSAQFDMGSLKPGSSIHIYCIKNINDTIGSAYEKINIIPKPEWLQKGFVENININNDTISMVANLPIDALLEDNVPNNIKAINNRSYSIFDNAIKFNIDYDYTNRISNASKPELVFKLNILDQYTKNYSIDLGESKELKLDSNFNLYIEAEKKVTTNSFNFKIPSIIFPVSGFCNIKIDAGLKLFAETKGKIVVGYQNEQWGFLKLDNEVTSLIAKLYGRGNISASLEVLGGLFDAEGILYVNGIIGGGIEYYSIPSNNISSVFGGELSISGRIIISAFLGITLWDHEKEFYNAKFGNLPEIALKNDKNINNIQSDTKKLYSSFMLPLSFPQPKFDVFKNRIACVWIERSGNDGNLFLSFLDKDSKIFHEPIRIISNKNSINKPVVALTSSGFAIIVWSQNKYTQETLPPNATIDDLIISQEIWCAVYNLNEEKIENILKISDDNSKGNVNPTISIDKNDLGAICWTILDSNRSKITSKDIFIKDGNWSISNGINISENQGYNNKVIIKGLNSGEKKAIWINNSDNEDENENSIMSNSFDGNWKGSEIFVDKKSGYKFKDLSFSVSDSFGSVSFVGTHYKDDGTFLNSLQTKFWNSNTGKWIDENRTINNDDSTICLKEPKIVVTKNGIAVLSLYQTPLFQDDTANSNNKELVFFLKDLKSNNSDWKKYNLITDDNIIIWSSEIAVNENILYLLTQEIDTVLGYDYSPKDGVRFGSLETGLVLRTWNINDDLSLTKVDEPGTPTDIKYIYSNDDFLLKQNYPNPFSESTIIEYKIPRNGFTKLELFDVLGNKFVTLVDDILTEGVYRTSFSSFSIPSGIYFYKLSSNGLSIVKSMLIYK